LAFSNIENNVIETTDIAIVDDEELEKNKMIKTMFDGLSNSSKEDRLFNTKYVSYKDAIKMLEDKEISCILKLEKDTAKIIVRQNGISETILKTVTEELLQYKHIAKNIVEIKIQENIENSNYNIEEINFDNDINKIITSKSNIKDISSSNLSYTMIEFYTLIAMTCLYGGTLGMISINQVLASMSTKGKRVQVSKTPKSKIILSSMLASYIIQLMVLLVLFLYTIIVLKVDYGNNLPLIILLGMVGSFAGLNFGVMIATCFKSNENTKIGIVIAFTMFCCFLSGMMGITMKYIIDKNIPILNKINPANMITDGFYSLYYYDTFDRYYFNIASLLIFSAIMIFASLRVLKKQKIEG